MNTRLYISPLTPDLLPVVVGASLIHSASDISYHSVETFPERRYGFLNLPAGAAEKIKKKLNGAVLRGSKMRVETARPEKRSMTEADHDDEGEATTRIRRSERRARKENGVISGVALPEGRKVKRGWTEPQATSDRTKAHKKSHGKEGKFSKSKAEPSAYTEQEECLFKTKLPPGKAKTKAESKKKAKSKKKTVDQETVVHEFEKTSKYGSFLRHDVDEKIKPVKQYDDAKGWIDTEGSVVEGPRRSKRTAQKQVEADVEMADTEKNPSQSDKAQDTIDDNETSSSGSSDAGDAQESADKKTEEPSTAAQEEKEATPAPKPAQVTTPVAAHPLETLFKRPTPRTASGSSARKPNLEVKIPFSFFSNETSSPPPSAAGNNASSHDQTNSAAITTGGLAASIATARKPGAGSNLSVLPPQTPFTQRDLHWRRQRSAAPTPDTAAPNRSTFGILWGPPRNGSIGADGHSSDHDQPSEEIKPSREEEDVEMSDRPAEGGLAGSDKDVGEENGSKEEGDDSDEASDAEGDLSSGDENRKQQEKAESEFAQWFWEKRGETNRAWKKRRREAGKEKRQRENKRRATAHHGR